MLKKLALGLALSAMTLPALAQQADQPAYLVATLEVADLAAYFDRYGGPLFPMLAAAGAEVLVGTPTVETLVPGLHGPLLRVRGWRRREATRRGISARDGRIR